MSTEQMYENKEDCRYKFNFP